MKKRLMIARRLLKPDSVLICTIDENELNHLGLLLEDLFRDARRQMVTICMNPGGASGGEGGLSRVEEHAVFCFFGNAQPTETDDDMLVTAADMDAPHIGAQGVRWEWLMRGGNAWYRDVRENLCYPILLNDEGTRIVGTGPPLEGPEAKRPKHINGHPVAWPVRRDKKLGIWRVDSECLMSLVESGYAFVSKKDEKRGTWTIKYLMSGTIEAIQAGMLEVIGKGVNGEVLVRGAIQRQKTAKTMWFRGRHTAGGAGGTHLLNDLLGERNVFPFPKSVYSVKDCLKIATGGNPNALILDFFAGSGTTLNATCLLNSEDGHSRRCVLVTNNEVNQEWSQALNGSGFFKGDHDYEKHGIFAKAARPRCEAAISGSRPDGSTPEGRYMNGRPYSKGFPENVEFFRIDYLDPDDVDLGRQFDAILPALWLAAGGIGERETGASERDYSMPDGSTYGVLFRESAFRKFKAQLTSRPEVTHVWLVTDSEEAFAEMCSNLPRQLTISMLYRDYLRNFRINTRRQIL
jgi:adenine-specific DNA-methyltransferase